jgi:hypothetical protein
MLCKVKYLAGSYVLVGKTVCDGCHCVFCLALAYYYRTNQLFDMEI